MAKEVKERYDFDIAFQWEIIRFTLKDKYGYKALLLYKFEYFSLIEQQLIARAIHHFFKLKKRIPSGSPVLIEEIKRLFKSRDYATAILQEDRKRIIKRIKSLYKSSLKDGEDILEKVKLFASYVEFKKTLEGVDLNNFGAYEGYAKKIQKAVNIGMQIDQKSGTFIAAAHRSRFIERRNRDTIVPTPYEQLNRLTNAGGYEKGSILVFLDKPKAGKTVVLVNCATSYAKRRKKVVYFDLENGESAISTRIDQNIGKLTKRDVLSGKFDKKLAKVYRALSRTGGEIYVKRVPALSTTDDLQKILDEIYQENGIKFDVCIIDYVGLMGAVSGQKEEFHRISEAYLDVKNLAQKNDLDLVLTGHHVIRAAYKRRETKYQSEDIAKCIDIPRHIDALIGCNQNQEEKQAGLFRLEMIEQRDGNSLGRVVGHFSAKTQRFLELQGGDLKEYYNVLGDTVGEESGEGMDSIDREKKKAKTRSDI